MNNCNIAVSTKLTFISSETGVGASTKLFVFYLLLMEFYYGQQKTSISSWCV